MAAGYKNEWNSSKQKSLRIIQFIWVWLASQKFCLIPPDLKKFLCICTKFRDDVHQHLQNNKNPILTLEFTKLFYATPHLYLWDASAASTLTYGGVDITLMFQATTHHHHIYFMCNRFSLRPLFHFNFFSVQIRRQ